MTDGNDTTSGGGAPAPLKIPGTSGASAPGKRFYTAVTVAAAAPAGDGAAIVTGPAASTSPRAGEASQPFRIHLDGRPVRTPAKRIVELPTRALAEAVAAEWEAQTERIEPSAMPLTRLVNSALDGVAARQRQVADDIVKYAGSDLICYRAEHPPELIARQAALWDPLLEWAAGELSGRFATSSGVMHVAQDPALLDRLAARLEASSTLQLAALHVMTTLAGSALIAWAHVRGRFAADAAWAAAHVDEDWQIEKWGEDAEASARRQRRWRDFEAASRLHRLSP